MIRRYTPAILHWFPGIDWRDLRDGNLPWDLFDSLREYIDKSKGG